VPVAIIDEPELHLHPALQTALIAYIRQLAQQDAAQFILATHSTTLMDALEGDELYVLAPPVMVGDGNQLTKLSATAERLEVVREITGSTYVVTRCRPIVFLEGERPGTKVMSDQRILEMLIPDAKGWVPVPSGGRSQAIKAAMDLRDPSLTELPGLPVFALVDRDQVAGLEPDYVITWPVCMIENLLLDPEAIWSLLRPTKETVGLASASDVAAILRRYCEENRAKEIRLRVRRRIEQPRWNLAVEKPDDAATLAARAGDVASEYIVRVGGEAAVRSAVAAAERDVDEILRSGQHLELFHGKDILRRFVKEYANRVGWAHALFAYQLAQSVNMTPRLKNLVGIPVRKIRQYVPVELVPHLAEARTMLLETPQQSDAEQAYESAAASRRAWEAGDEDEQDRPLLRRRLVATARAVKQMGRADLHEKLLADLVQLGTG
jgi:AAA domain, putative AbiEii toxin, Type IV TA system